MIVMGVDPGTRVTGYGVVENSGSHSKLITFGAIRARSDDLPDRLRQIFQELRAVIEAHHPDQVAVEQTFFGRNAQSTIKIGEARAVALLAAAIDEIPIAEYSPSVVKKSVVGVGTAHKSQVQQMVTVILGLDKPPTPEDASDALAIALCHCNRLHKPRSMPTSGTRRGGFGRRRR